MKLGPVMLINLVIVDVLPLFTWLGGVYSSTVKQMLVVKTTCGDTVWKSLNWLVISSEKELDVTTL